MISHLSQKINIYRNISNMDSQDKDILISLVLDIKKDLSDLKDNQSETQELTVKNTIILEEHMRRTSIAEERIEMLQKDLEPIKDHVKSVHAIASFLTKSIKVVGIIVTLIGSILAWFSHPWKP